MTSDITIERILTVGKAHALHVERFSCWIVGTAPLMRPAWGEQVFDQCIVDPSLFPSSAIKRAMINVPRNFDGIWVSIQQIRDSIVIERGPYLQIIGEPRIDIFTCGKDERRRTRFFPWAIELQVSVNTNVLSHKHSVCVLSIAGVLGLGEWRPIYGTFVVSEEASILEPPPDNGVSWLHPTTPMIAH